MSDDGDGARDPHVNDANGDANDARCGNGDALPRRSFPPHRVHQRMPWHSLYQSHRPDRF